MRPVFFVLALFGSALFSGTAAGNSKAIYAVTHVDIGGGGSVLAQVTGWIREFEAASRKDPGSMRFEVYQQDGHPNHFTIYEVWQTRHAFDAHAAAVHTRQFRERIQPLLGSPFRERFHRVL